MLQRTAVVSSKERESQSAGQVLFGKGGLGYVARRGIDFGTAVNLLTVEGLARMAIQQPLELLSLLPDIVPEVGLALWNSTFLACGPESVRIKAVTRRPDGGSEEAPEGTAAIKELWEKNPDEVGGLIDAFGQNYQMAMFAGMCAAEAVPGNRGKGVRAVYPVNTLTLRFKREDDGSLALYQRQTANPNGLGIYTAGFGGLFLPMPMNRFFYSRLPALPDEPYGRAPMASALTAVLENLGFMRDLLFAWHRVGNPSTDISVDYELLMKLGRDVVGLTDQKEIEAFARAKAQEQQAQYQNKKADDAYFHDVNTKVNTVSATWPSFEKLWSMLRLRLIQALKMLPALMGIMEGDSETWTKVQFDIFVTSIMAVRNVAMSPLVKASQLHLQLCGMPFFAEAEFSQVRNVARLMDAQAEAIEIQNEANKVSQNWQLNNTAAQVITGSACPSEQDRVKDTPPKGPLQGTAGTVGTTGTGRADAPTSKQAA